MVATTRKSEGRPAHPHVHALLSPRLQNGSPTRLSPRAIQAVRGLSLTVQEGEVVTLIGANGAGKTTTMRILSTLDLPTSGTVRLGGINVVEQPNDVRRRLAWMPDHFTPYKDTTVLQYLDFFARAQDLHGEERTRRLAEIADFTNLHPLRERPVDKLSKGQLQRVCLARALLNDPEFLILDEPVAGLDPKARHEFKHLIHLLRDRGKTMLISSHILSELGEMCDSLLFMDRGKVVHHSLSGQRDVANHLPVEADTIWRILRRSPNTTVSP